MTAQLLPLDAPTGTVGGPQGVGHGLFSRFRIGTRLAAMMVLAALVSAVLATSGIQGLAAANQSLQVVYEDRMKPVRTLGQISQMMLANQHQLQLALAQTASSPTQISLHPDFASRAASAIEKNVAAIDQLWSAYAATAKGPLETALADQFARHRAQYLRESVMPALAALRKLDYHDTQRLAKQARTLYENASPHVQALIDLQFDQAQAEYASGVQRYEQTRSLALGALLGSMGVLGFLGMMLIRSIVRPLRQVSRVFHRIANGRLNTPIVVQGKDEISELLADLQLMQQRLAANEEAIHRLAYYDPLTGLPNRHLLRERMQAALADSRQDDRHRALLLLDLDHFKNLNDALGHEVGDQYLVEMAQRLCQIAQPPHAVARIGGDEFVVLADALATDETAALAQAQALAHDILTAVARPCTLAGQLYFGSASIGICLFRNHNASIQDLLRRADAAMYQAKNAGRNEHCLFDPSMQAELEVRRALETALRGAIDAEQLQLHYQAQVSATGRLVGAEVLLRWNHPVHGSVPPAQFIPIAEATGLILPIGSWVLAQACAQLKDWETDPHTRHLDLAVNVSARQFRQPGFVDQVRHTLAQAGANPARLVLELTESLVLDDLADTVTKMQALQQIGVRFALDDFGTGYSSLAQLKRLPLHHLKIDRSFVQDIVSDPSDAAIVQTIIGMARNLGLQVIAEGVETLAQRQALLHLQCLVFQGFYFSHPLPIGAFGQWMDQPPVSTVPPAATATPMASPQREIP
ncbi:MAG: EAL domain-containing protein [Giesbergeria sp.]|jgi:diguanylate cyclase (GGDEF)-like protein|nr:EAL domain-containing protein [Giesbergeria sp.]